MKNLFLLIALCLCTSCISQNTFNLSFEELADDFPTDWEEFGQKDYQLSIDKSEAQDGNNSAVIEYNGDKINFKAWAYTIPAIYEGKKIKLTGYMKTENVQEGWAGLWLRVDPRVAFNNMKDRGVEGTTEWQKYEIELDYNSRKATKIVFGGLLSGKGKMWIDNLQLSIDGKELKDVSPVTLLPAQNDKEFDNGSNISIPDLEDNLTNDLVLLGKIWGFLKYHHPAVGKGDYNWDYELFRFLPNYLKSKNNEERDDLLIQWIDQYGAVPECTTCENIPEEAFLKPDHQWMEDGNISKILYNRLQNIFMNRYQGDHFYISTVPYVGNPEFLNENQYQNMPYPDDGFRLLALYKYWNMIHYFFSYRHLIDKDWNQNLKEYLPKFLSAKNELEYELAAIQIIGDIKDTHANLWGGKNATKEIRGKNYPPFHLRFIEDQLVVTDIYNPELITDIEIGDVITNINGEQVKEMVDRLNAFYPASNQPTRLRDMSRDLLRSNNNSIRVQYERKQMNKTIDLSLFPADSLNIFRWYRNDDEKSFKMLEDNIGYITLKNIQDEDIPLIKEEFKDTKGIIIDIRNYPSTFVPFSLGSYFIADTTAFVKFTTGDPRMPGTFTMTDNLEIPNDENHYYKGKLVVLVNELSQSQAEYTAMVFRAGDNTTIIGSTTAGADGNVSNIYLPGGLRTMISGIGVYYPDGTETQRVGIQPDLLVEPTIEGIRAGKDELLLKAIEVIKNDD